MELLNHDDQHNIFYDAIVKLSLENSTQENCSELGYEKKSNFIDLTPLFDQIKEKPVPQKSWPIRFLEAAGLKFDDPFSISFREEAILAQDKTLDLLNSIDKLQIWNVPNWMRFFHEDEESPQDIVESDEGFEAQLAAFEEILKNPLDFCKQFVEPKDFILKRLGSELYDSNNDEVQKKNWFCEEDDDTYAILYNISERTVRAGEQVNMLYGRLSNRQLLKHYGFVLKSNVYDSVNFYYPAEEVRLKYGLQEPVYFGYVSPFTGRSFEGLSPEQTGVEYRSKSSRINMELLVEVQTRQVKFQLEDNISKLSERTIILHREKAAILEYTRLFEIYLQQNLRSKSEYINLFERYKSDERATSILTFEFGLLQIVEAQLRLAGLCRLVVEGCLEAEIITEECFKKIYIDICQQAERPGSSHLAKDLLGISSFLHLLYSKLFVTKHAIPI